MKLMWPAGGYAEGPGSLLEYKDLSNQAPGGWNFAFQVEKNLIPKEKESGKIKRVSGPGEPGFKWTEQKNLVPEEVMKNERGK